MQQVITYNKFNIWHIVHPIWYGIKAERMENSMHNKPIALVILDGFGISTKMAGNAIAAAHIPHLTAWIEQMPVAFLAASGTAVGLPDGYVGNSEVGHLTIGAGRIIKQPITFINEAIHDGSLFENPVLKSALEQCLKANKNFHIIGILSDAGIHGSQDHIVAYAQMAHQCGLKNIYIHAILDGRDTLPYTAEACIDQLIAATRPYNAQIVTIHGRFYAMDRNKNYDRTVKSYLPLVDHHTPITEHWRQFLYPKDGSEEYCEPMRIIAEGYIEDYDTVLFTACKSDRMRQLVSALAGDTRIIGTLPSIHHLVLLSPVPYSKSVALHALYTYPIIQSTLKEVLCTADRTVFSVAETEKYAHVTFFFNGEKESVLPCEVRHLIPSIRARRYVDNPAMSAEQITDTVIRSLTHDPKDFYVINYANADMVGHSGNFAATIKAVEFLDHELGRLYNELVVAMDGTLFITGDHGNAEQQIDPETGEPSPMHTKNPVPFIVVTQKPLSRALTSQMHGLADIAPLILKYMGIPVPPEMTGSDNH